VIVLKENIMPGFTARKIKFATIADVQERLGHVPESRILSFPAPGTATVQDLLDSSITNGRSCELVEGILVEKAMGFRSEYIAYWIGYLIAAFLEENNIGAVFGSQAPIRFRLNLVLIPDVGFIRWDSVEDTDVIENPSGAFLEVPPDLAVEVLSPGNTRKEMDTKLKEYAKARVELVWYVDPERNEVDVYPKGSAKRKKTFGINDTLDGGEVLPGFTLPVAKIFKKRAPARKPEKKGKK
jgi:Uma2 family endonuclease